MDNLKKYEKWVSSKMRLGWIMLALGLLTGIAGILAQALYGIETFNFRIITSLGFLFIGMGAATLIRYRKAIKNEEEARRLKAKLHDERTLLIRRRAGNRAYWVSMVMIYMLLMWESFSINGSLPRLSSNTLWYCLAACVMIPLCTYIVSAIVDEQKL